MGALCAVVSDPVIKVSLQFLDRVMELPARRHLVEFLQDDLVEALADADGLRALRLWSMFSTATQSSQGWPRT